MTFKEKYIKGHQRDDIAHVMRFSCPEDTSMGTEFCKLQRACIDCWNREIPESDDIVDANKMPEKNGLSGKCAVHASICSDLTALYERKNHDYGDSFGKGFAEYGMTMPCIRLEDKLNRLKSLLKSGAQVKGESIDDTLMDLANYAIMTLIERGSK